MAFAFLFGLSMDYEVFILSRMGEAHDATGSTEQAVVTGIGRSGRLVTSAAPILFLAFSSLASGPEVVIKIFATGLAARILLDATVVRCPLVPSLVRLFGRWNWWLPRMPARLLRVEPSLPPTAASPPPAGPLRRVPPLRGLRSPGPGCTHCVSGAIAGWHSSQRSRCESGAVPQL